MKEEQLERSGAGRESGWSIEVKITELGDVEENNERNKSKIEVHGLIYYKKLKSSNEQLRRILLLISSLIIYFKPPETC